MVKSDARFEFPDLALVQDKSKINNKQKSKN